MNTQFDNLTDERQFIEDLHYEEGDNKIITALKKVNDPKLLFMFVSGYNWDSGFSIPREILENPCCDMSTALLLFERSGGHECLYENGDIEKISNSNGIHAEQMHFVKETYNRIVKHDFTTGQTEFKPEITESKVQIYKLKKINPDIPDIFINGIKLQ